MGMFKRAATKEAYQNLILKITRKSPGSDFNTSEIIDGISISRANALQVIKSMECTKPLTDPKNYGAAPKEWVLISKADLNGICAQCTLANLEIIAKGGRICPKITPLEMNNKAFKLTPQEAEIVAIISDGTTARSDIAKKLGISENTLKKEIGRLLAKLEVETGKKFNSIDAVDYMKKTGLI